MTEFYDRAHTRKRLAREDGRPTRADTRSEQRFSGRWFIRHSLRLSGFWPRAQRNALTIRATHHDIRLPALADALQGFRILHLSDLHLDMTPEVGPALIAVLQDLEYDLCVLTGDYRSSISGPIDATMACFEELVRHLTAPVYAVLGNHDSIQMVPGLERLGVRMLMNENVLIERDGATFTLAGVDDPQYYRVHDIEKAAHGIAAEEPSILLSHTPEIYRQAADAGFDVFFCGHTHGGQICLPGGFPLTLDARVPRRLGRGRWRHRGMIGYTSAGSGTSIVQARLNCPAEVTLHRLLCD